MPPFTHGESLEGGDSDDFEEHRIRRSDEQVPEQRVEDVAIVDDQLGDLVGGQA